jgi:hypothetical protein
MHNASMRIAELNRTHPLNRLAADCLQGYPWSAGSQLAVLALIEAYWDEVSNSSILNQRGGPSTRRVEAALRMLARADPDAVMDYLTKIGGKPVIDLDRLRESDGDAIAHEVIQVVVSQLMLGALLPRKS